ncbi:putative phage-associated protein [Lachnospiraceae bacterium TWA4]|nr:putative phage-associated protein [Lachnospiraceae bacterium TWA4]
MNIIWQYLDKRSAAINALKDYSSMKFIIENTDEEIKVVSSQMIGLGSHSYDGMPRASKTNVTEERILNGIEEIDVLKERYRQAIEYMEWFEPAWNQLTDDERYVLEIYYLEEDLSGNVVYTICNHFCIERSSAYNKKNRAVNHLATLLFGKA